MQEDKEFNQAIDEIYKQLEERANTVSKKMLEEVKKDINIPLDKDLLKEFKSIKKQMKNYKQMKKLFKDFSK